MLSKPNTFILLTVMAVIFPDIPINAQKFADWHQWQFLIGEWIGKGGGDAPGQGTGGSKFYFDLDSTILVRENYA